MDQLLTPSDVAETYRIPSSTLTTWRARGYGPPAIRLGRVVRYRVADVERFVAELVADARREGAIP